jgi:hypothetical protein
MTEVRGRPPGAQNAQRRLFSKTFFRALLRDFKAHGEAAITACRERDPVAYVKTGASLMPKDIELIQTAGDQVRSMTDEELAALLQVTMAKLVLHPSSIEG